MPLELMDCRSDIIFQILTKRPGNIARRLDDLNRRLPDHVWLGVTVGHVDSLPLLKAFHRVESRRKFISMEPMLTPMPDLTEG
jgi:protein gp37